MENYSQRKRKKPGVLCRMQKKVESVAVDLPTVFTKPPRIVAVVSPILAGIVVNPQKVEIAAEPTILVPNPPTIVVVGLTAMARAMGQPKVELVVTPPTMQTAAELPMEETAAELPTEETAAMILIQENVARPPAEVAIVASLPIKVIAVRLPLEVVSAEM